MRTITHYVNIHSYIISYACVVTEVMCICVSIQVMCTQVSYQLSLAADERIKLYSLWKK